MVQNFRVQNKESPKEGKLWLWCINKSWPLTLLETQIYAKKPKSPMSQGQKLVSKPGRFMGSKISQFICNLSVWQNVQMKWLRQWVAVLFLPIFSEIRKVKWTVKLICYKDTDKSIQQRRRGNNRTTYSQTTNLEKRIFWLQISTNYSYIVSPESFRQEGDVDTAIRRCQILKNRFLMGFRASCDQAD